jgi:hypothetical protein
MFLLLFFSLKTMPISLGAEHKRTFDIIKEYLSLVLVLKAPKSGFPFVLYIATKYNFIGAILTQETERKEYIITYLCCRLMDAKTRYTFIGKLCLCFLYACTKCGYYILSSSCIVACQLDVIKCIFAKPNYDW